MSAMINALLWEGCLPFKHKRAIVTSLLKKPELDADELNYRPVSNLTFVSKLVERVDTLRLVSYLNDQDLMPQLQSAYRRFHSTETAIMEVLLDVYCAIESTRCTAWIVRPQCSVRLCRPRHFTASVACQIWHLWNSA